MKAGGHIYNARVERVKGKEAKEQARVLAIYSPCSCAGCRVHSFRFANITNYCCLHIEAI